MHLGLRRAPGRETAVRRAWAFARKLAGEFFEEAPFEQAAAVSYYALLALAPFLLLVVSLAGLAFGREAVQRQMAAEIEKLIGERGAEAIELVLENADEPRKSLASLAVGAVTLLVGASGVFVQLQASLNHIWDVRRERKGPAVWRFLRHRLISMAMVLGLGFLMLVSLVISAGLSAIDAHYRSALPWPWVWRALNAGASLVVITLLIGMIFRFLPDVRIAWRDVWSGALITAVLFTLGKAAIGTYLGRASIGSAYGAAGSVVVMVVWVYYASLIFFLGAQVTHVQARRRKARSARPA